MASKGSKPAASVLLALNIFLYFILIILSSWAISHGIQRSQSAYGLTLPAKIFPMYFPIGNMVTGFFVILSLIAGVVGFTTSVTGLYNVNIWNGANLHSAGASSLISLALTLLAMGFACKEIEIGWTDTEFKFESNLRTLEVFTIIVSATQIFSTFAIQAGVEEAISHEKFRAGRV